MYNQFVDLQVHQIVRGQQQQKQHTKKKETKSLFDLLKWHSNLSESAVKL